MEYRKAANRSLDNATTLINPPYSSSMATSTEFSSSVSSQTSQGSHTATTPLGTPSGAPRTKSWHVPGPSTRYHKSEHARPKPTPRSSATGQHVRNHSSLSTRSSYTEASNIASPLARLNFTRDSPKDYVYNPNDTIKPRNNPATPLRSPHLASNNFNNLRFQGSPFSDYFTDDAKSVDHNAPYHPSDPAQKLLLRLNNLGGDILRLGLQDDSLSEFNEKLCTLEAMVNDGGFSDAGSAIEERDRRDSFPGRLYTEDHSQGHDTRDRILSPEHSNKSRLSDVWMADACEYADTFTQTVDESQHGLAISYATSATQTEQEASKDMAESSVWINNYADVSTQTTDDRLVADLQEVVERLAKANDSLRQRYDQSKDVCDTQSVQIEELTTQLMTVKSENDSLKQDLGFDHSELLFLKLQLQALEVQKENYDHNNHVLLAEDFAQWKADWDSVDARLRSRRQKNRVTSADIKDLPDLDNETNIKPEDQGNWQLETRKHRHGRVHSITLKRVDEPETQTEEGALIDSHFDIPASPTVKIVYSEQSTQTEEVPSEDHITQTEVSTPVTQGTQTEKEPSLSTSEIRSQQTEPIEPVEAEDEAGHEVENEIEQGTTTQAQLLPASTPCCQKEHLCTACGEKFDYSSEDDEVDHKTPWQELCDGLVAFAGMQRE
ncbi:unnamed protein product [Aureobasidium vineae]|uniref:Uncharacterized protein n=1 Tax=Aureobasidium vineae TaxID=2773715 RepID=A0A9N8JEI6_9PEZI|nr:unnamed protein product [Aureobasidium vineae]